jgi:GNAT superfamily N-acetyltransferase
MREYPLLPSANLELAVRLERAVAAIAQDAVEAHRRLYPDSAAEWIACAGGVAAFIDEASPLTQIKGAGMDPPVMEASLDTAEEFYEQRQAPVTFCVTPFADPALFTYLSRRGYEIGAFENTLIRAIAAGEEWERCGAAIAEDAREWSTLLAEAFFDVVTPGGLQLGQTLFAIPSCRNIILRAEGTGVAAAQLDIRDRLAVFQCDGTLRRYRGNGLQKMLIRERLALAAAEGCDLAMAETQPGSISQANYEALGFRVAYTRITLVKPCM